MIIDDLLYLIKKYHHDCYRIWAKVRRGKLLGTDCRWYPSRMHTVIIFLLTSAVDSSDGRKMCIAWLPLHHKGLICGHALGSSVFLFCFLEVKKFPFTDSHHWKRVLRPLKLFIFILQQIQLERDKITRHRVKPREYQEAAAPYSTIETTMDKGFFLRSGLLRRRLMLN